MPTLLERLITFRTQPNTVLFAGAGVGKRVDLPTWPEYLSGLADVCRQFGDQLSGDLILQKISEEDYLGAATVYRACKRIPQGESHSALAAPFRRTLLNEEIDRLVPVVGLGYSAIVTTNYDRSLHDAYSRMSGRAPIPVELDDNSLRGAALRKEHFIARIHGRAELPKSIVLSQADYDRLRSNSTYLDFVMDILKTRHCLFVGFSFADPALAGLLALYQQNFGPHFPSFHVALVASADAKLVSRLREVNIDVWEYRPDNGHRELWQSFRDTYDRIRVPAGVPGTERSATVPTRPAAAHRFMAFAYSQLQVRAERGPITRAVHDGVVHAIIAEAGDSGASRGEVVQAVRVHLTLSADEAEEAVLTSIASLAARKDVAEVGERYYCVKPPSSALSDHVTELARSLLTRMRVRERVILNNNDEKAARRLIEDVLLARAWDVAAHFAGAATGGWAADLPNVVERIISQLQKRGTLSAPGAMARALLDVLQSPEDREAELLAQLGRAAFGLQVLLATPRQALLQKYALPQRIYLDANILLPAITEGYPLRPLYLDLLQRMATAASQAGVPFRIIAGSPFADEIIHHRKKAQELVYERGLQDPDRLTRHIGFYSATNTNVFVGGYASFVGRGKNEIPFEDFLKRAAPYDDRKSLEQFLKRVGIDTEWMDYREDQHDRFRDIYNKLLEGYEGDKPWYERSKDTVLIVHEAQQLTRLRVDAEEGVRSIFVTADARLRRIMHADSRLHDLLGATVTDLGLVALVDVMIGLSSDARATSRLFWAIPQQSGERAVFDYFVGLALREYEYGLDIPMQEVASSIARQAVADAKTLQLDLLSNSPNDVARTAEFLDRYENQFFERLKAPRS